MECGLVGDGEFVGPCGQAAPLLEAVDAPLDGFPLLVGLTVETGRAATESASPQTVADLVGRLRDDRADSPAPQRGRPEQRWAWSGACPDRCGSRGYGPSPSRRQARHPKDGRIDGDGPVDVVGSVRRCQDRGGAHAMQWSGQPPST